MLARSVKPKTCLHCGKPFVPFQSMQKVCATIKCAKGYAKAVNAQGRRELRARKEALKRIPELIEAAQKEFNAFIRLRDFGKPCICCGKPLGEGEVGGAFDCGHYRSRGSAPHLRFDERNAHAQRKYCNRHGAGRAVDYRLGLIARIGLEAVEALESDNAVHRWTREELKAIRDEYRKKRRDLEAKNADC
jgi:hypothetical protein